MALEKILDRETSLCVKCGSCRSVCPVISVVGREHGTARGKIALAEQFINNGGWLGDKFREAIMQCLLCMSCTEVCANRVRTDKIILATRNYINEKNIIERISKFVKIFAFRHVTFISGSLRFLQRVLMEKGDSGEVQRLRFHIHRFYERYLPVLNKGPFLSGVDEALNGEKKTKYAFFVGCMLNVAYQEVAEKTHKLLRMTGAGVIVPKKQVCCGLPLVAEGWIEEARELAKENMDTFTENSPDRIVVACASCGSMLKEYYPYIFAGTEYEERAIEFAKKIVDVSEVLVNKKFDVNKNVNSLRSVTFHDPCHLKRGMGVSAEPREIIKRFGYELLEMKEADRCCGFSGSFSFRYPDLSEEILNRKVKNALSSGAEAVVTSCPGCIMQLRSGFQKANAGLKVRHFVELLL